MGAQLTLTSYSREIPRIQTSPSESGREGSRVAVFNQVQMDLDGVEKRKQQIQKKIIKFCSQMLCILLIVKRKSAYFAAKMNEYLEKKKKVKDC